MFGLGGLEIVVIFVVALVVLGPDKLPQVAQKLARLLGEVRRVTDQVKQEVEDAASAGHAETPRSTTVQTVPKKLPQEAESDARPEAEKS